MKAIQQALLTFIIIAISTTASWAEMPDALKGSWILDTAATEKYMQTSPKWTPEDAKYLPMILKRMSQAVYEFKENAFIVSMRGKTQTLPIILKHSEKQKYIFEGTLGDQTMTLTASITDEGNLNVRSSATDDMTYYLWKRGQPDTTNESK